jgi:hypothetical protein
MKPQYTTQLNENGELDIVPVQQKPAPPVMPTQQKRELDPNPAFYIQRIYNDTRVANIQHILDNGEYKEQLWVSYTKPNGFILSEPATKEHIERWPDAYETFLMKCREEQQQKIQAEQFELRRRVIAEEQQRKRKEAQEEHRKAQEAQAAQNRNSRLPTFDEFPNFDPQAHFINNRAR